MAGGGGYVGTTLIPFLLAKGWNVRVLDNLMFGGDPLLPFFRFSSFEFQLGDVRNPEDLKAAVKDVDAVIHLAAIVGYPACRKNPQLAEQVNVGGTRNLIDVLSKNQLIIYASAGSNYGSVDEICTEETPLNPLSLYGQTKTLAEKIILDRGNAIAYRFTTAFGVSPRTRLDLLINAITHKAVTQGCMVRKALHANVHPCK